MKNARDQSWRPLANFLDHTAEAILLTDARTRIVYVNRSFTRITGYTLKEVFGKTPRLLHSGRQAAKFYAKMWTCINKSGRWQGEIWNRRRNGAIYPEWLSITAVRNSSGKVGNYLAIFSDITLRKRETQDLYDLATHDALTGLPNRFFFNERFRHALARAKRAGHLVGLLYLDLDRFKPVNDSLGHKCGDKLLQTVARRIRRLVREGDTTARLGGDEFAVILEHLSQPRDAEVTATKLLHAMARPFLLEGHTASITASIGITVYPLDGDDVEILLKRADKAMYRGKSERGNDYRFWGDPTRYSQDGRSTRRKRKPASETRSRPYRSALAP